MRQIGERNYLRAAGVVSIGILVFGASWLMTATKAHAQVGLGEYWLYQPQQPEPVGRAWCSVDHSVEYWAYVVGEYQFSSSINTSANRANLDFEFASTAEYLTLAEFEEEVLGLPEMSGKTVRFESHAVVGETIEN